MIADRGLWVDAEVADQLGVTERYCDVLCLIASGLSNAEIGKQLFIATSTAKTHVARLRRRLGATDRAHAVALAYEHGLLRTPYARSNALAAAGGWATMMHNLPTGRAS